MARSLNYTIEYIFTWNRTSNHSTIGGYNMPRNNKTVYLEVPINSSAFELPCFVRICTDINVLLNNDTEVLAVSLNTINRIPRYTTLSAYMKDVLMDNFNTNRLVMLKTKNTDDTEAVYYATFGAIFDDSFKPLLMCSWLVERGRDESGNLCVKYIKPIVRVDPSCYVRKNNPIEKFIAGKFIQTVLTQSIPHPVYRFDYKFIKNAEVEIAECPFNLKQSETPSISTTNEELIQIAKEYLNDVIDDN